MGPLVALGAVSPSTKSSLRGAGQVHWTLGPLCRPSTKGQVMKQNGVAVPNRIGMALLATMAISTSALARGSYSFQTIDLPFGSPGVDINLEVVWINSAGVI